MTIIAYAGEEVRDNRGKLVATLASDIHSGDLNLRPNQFIMADEVSPGGFITEEIYEFVRGKLSSPSEAPVGTFDNERVEPEAEIKPDDHYDTRQSETVSEPMVEHEPTDVTEHPFLTKEI